MTSLYNRTALSPYTRATSEAVNSETQKIQTAIDNLQSQIAAIVAGTPIANYTWIAWADSADGTSNFTTGDPGTRQYQGIAYGQASSTESEDPTAYTWHKFRGDDGNDGNDGDDGDDGDDGTDGNWRDIKFIRQWPIPSIPTDASPAGWSDSIPDGDETLWVIVATKNGSGVLQEAWSLAQLTTNANRGNYSASETYYLGNVVLKNGGSYICVVDETTGNAPSGTAQPNAYWEVLAAPGDEGDPASPPSAYSATIDLTSSSSGANLRTIADADGYTGKSDATITFRVPSGVTVQGLQNSGVGVDTGIWPSADYTIAIDLVIQNGGKVYGGGGRGGAGGHGGNGSTGGAGGAGVYLREDMDVTIDSGGELKGGGGGGGGGAGTTPGGFEPEPLGGSGGGGGYPNGSGGLGALDGNDGSAGTVSGGGAGGAGAPGGGSGGAGGDAATAGTSVTGASGGAAGYAVRKNGYTSTVSNSGTMAGTAA